MAERPRLPKCPTNLKLSSKELGRGAHGAVRVGKFNGRPVAVKTVHSEIARDKPLMLVLERMKENLREYLQGNSSI